MSIYAELADRISLEYDLRLPPHDEDRAFLKRWSKYRTSRKLQGISNNMQRRWLNIRRKAGKTAAAAI